MSQKRKAGSGSNGARGKQKRPWRPDANLSGHGIFMTCVRGKEKQAASDLVEILTDTARTLYPEIDLTTLPAGTKGPALSAPVDAVDEDDLDAILNGGPPAAVEAPASAPVTAPAPQASVASNDIEAELRAELAELQAAKPDRGKFARRQGEKGGSSDTKTSVPPFRSIETGTECLVYVSVHANLDPFELVHSYLSKVEITGEARSRFISRLSPVASFESASIRGVESLCQRWLPKLMPEEGHGTFKIDPRIRAHSILKRDDVIASVGALIPRSSEPDRGYSANLKDPTHWIVIEIHKSQASIGVLRDYMRLCRYNPSELANHVKGREGAASDSAVKGRVGGSETVDAKSSAEVDSSK
ncbi:unnamed protein product [Parajaminaea phylloscopi]